VPTLAGVIDVNLYPHASPSELQSELFREYIERFFRGILHTEKSRFSSAERSSTSRGAKDFLFLEISP